ncbi:IscS subfamily cysteine desulfurase [Metabacillus sp. 84]|uniref:IscS subfamily cysteine desulfurase n=1 Tax=unclassified Metabacillus TaxID=2675274 RepID=UPI003CEC2D35
MIYLDYAATAPMRQQAVDAYAKAAKTVYGNSQSLHEDGGRAAEWLNASRKKIASFLGGEAKGLYFTGSGSEANTLAIRSLLNGADTYKNEIVSGGMEHASIRTYLDDLSKSGYVIRKVLPGENGHIGAAEVEPHLSSRTALITVQHANSETGIVHDIKEISRLAQRSSILFHSDCVQTFGKIPIPAEEWGLSAVSISAHKIGGPKGMGAAYITPEARWRPVIEGTAHEGGFRPGTADVPGAVSFAVAAMETMKHMDREWTKMREYRKHLTTFVNHTKLGKIVEAARPEFQLPGITGILLSHREGQYAMLACSQMGIAVSTGSACHAGMTHPPPALLALGIPEEEAHCFIRVSAGEGTALAHLEKLEAILSAACSGAERMNHL